MCDYYLFVSESGAKTVLNAAGLTFVAKSLVIKQLRAARDFLFAQKYRFDQGLQFLVFVNFALLILTASDKLKVIFGLNRISEVAALMVVLGFVGTWAFGLFLDKIVHSQQSTESETLKRSLLWQRNFAELEGLKREVRQLRAEIRKR